ncbi:hypothetical protein [Levilactobacillus sp. HBUAS70063]
MLTRLYFAKKHGEVDQFAVKYCEKHHLADANMSLKEIAWELAKIPPL